MSKRQAVLGKLKTLYDLKSSGLLTDERISESLKASIASGDFPEKLPISAFEKQTPELLTFAQSLGLVKEKGAKPAGSGRSESSYHALILKQYPQFTPHFEVVEELRKQTFTVADEEGKSHAIKFMPFYRDVTPKPEATTTEVKA